MDIDTRTSIYAAVSNKKLKTEPRVIFLDLLLYPYTVYMENGAIYMYKYTENGTNGKRQLPFVCCKQKRKKEDFFLGWQTINVIDNCCFITHTHIYL